MAKAVLPAFRPEQPELLKLTGPAFEAAVLVAAAAYARIDQKMPVLRIVDRMQHLSPARWTNTIEPMKPPEAARVGNI